MEEICKVIRIKDVKKEAVEMVTTAPPQPMVTSPGHWSGSLDRGAPGLGTSWTSSGCRALILSNSWTHTLYPHLLAALYPHLLYKEVYLGTAITPDTYQYPSILCCITTFIPSTSTSHTEESAPLLSRTFPLSNTLYTH